MKNITIPLFAVLLLLFAACKKEYPTIYMSDEMKQYVMQPVGTKWVYKDSATGQIENVELTEQHILISNGGEGQPYSFELLGQSFYSSNGNYKCRTEYPYITNANSERVLNYHCRGEYIDKFKVGEKFGYYLYAAFYDSLQINNVWYKKIKLFYNIKDEPIIYNFYWARGVGLIRWTVGNPSSIKSVNLVTFQLPQ